MVHNNPVPDIRNQFPHPVVLADDNLGSDGLYCVAGAICLYFGTEDSEETRFPGQSTLFLVLHRLRPGFDREAAARAAQAVIERNDEGDFEGAWRAAESFFNLEVKK